MDESAWTVCDQEPAAGTTIGSAPRLTVDRTCGNEDSLEGAEEETEPHDDTTAEPNKKADTKQKAETPQPWRFS